MSPWESSLLSFHGTIVRLLSILQYQAADEPSALHNCLSPILASLFSGNAIVLKCSEHVAWSTSWFIQAVRQCLVICGHSPDLVQLVCCYPSEAEALTTSPYIKYVSFPLSLTTPDFVLQTYYVHRQRNSWPQGPASCNHSYDTCDPRTRRQGPRYNSSRNQSE